MHHALPAEPIPDPHLRQKLHRALFQDPGSHPVFDMLPVVNLQDYGVDPTQLEQSSEG